MTPETFTAVLTGGRLRTVFQPIARRRSGIAIEQLTIEVTEHDRPHLILLDVAMPGTDGLTACRALRSHEQTRHTPIILVATRGEEWDVAAGFTSGCNDHVTKPVDQLELLSKIESWLFATDALQVER